LKDRFEELLSLASEKFISVRSYEFCYHTTPRSKSNYIQVPHRMSQVTVKHMGLPSALKRGDASIYSQFV